jgi:hypothetical protein
MDDAGSPRLQLINADENVRRFDALLETIGGVARSTKAPQARPPTASEFYRLVTLVMRLEQRMEALEAESVPLHRSRKCPCCHQLSLVVVASQPHPQFGTDGVEQHDVRCGCGYRGPRLYDPRDFLR